MSQTSISEFPAVAYAGMLSSVSKVKHAITRFNKETSAEIPFGVGVKQGSNENECLLPASNTDAILGIVIHSHDYDTPTELGDTGVKPGAPMSILVEGEIYVQVEEAVSPGDRGFCRAVATGNEQLGAWRKSADSTDCIDCSNQTMFLSAAGAGGFARMKVNFLNHHDAVT